MSDSTEDRAVQVANFMIRNQSTIRKAAEEFHVSPTTISHDLRKRLPKIDEDLANKVGRLLRHNAEVRVYRGGESIRRKYKRNKKNKKD